MTGEAKGIGAVEQTAAVLDAMCQAGGPVSLGELSGLTKMPSSRLHRYLASLQRSGLVFQEGRGGRYDLGPKALDLGLAALGRLDAEHIVYAESRNLAQTEQVGVAVTVLNENQPVIIAHHHGPSPVSVSARPGQRLPLVHTAVGRTFLAFMPRSHAQPLIDAAYDDKNPPTDNGRPLTRKAFGEELDSIFERGYARLRGSLARHVNALAAPVFDAWGNVPMVISMLGDAAELDPCSSERADALLTATRRAAERLGYRRG